MSSLALLAAAVSAFPGAGTAAAAGAHAAGSPQPKIVPSWIRYGPTRKSHMAAYAKRHYGVRAWTLTPKVLVEHWTQSYSYRNVWLGFAADKADPELHELPGLCSHFIVERNGRIHQLVPLGVMCRHTVGLNDRAIGVENIGMSDADVMKNAVQLTATVRLARWIRCAYGIKVKDIIGHNESLRSPWHHERVRALRKQTHDDMKRSTMNHFRRLVERASC